MNSNNNLILEYLRTNNETLFNKIVNTLREKKEIDFTTIDSNDIIVLSPQKAFEYAGEEGDKYFKIWMVGNNIAWCTWANSMIDSNFRWNAKARNENKRDNKDILGNEPYISAYLTSNSAIEQCSVVYMFPFEAFSKKKTKRNDNRNSILEYLQTNNPSLFERIINSLRNGKQIDFTSIKQNNIIVLSPQKAFEYAGEEGDKYFKVWMVGNNIAWCTWANSMVDSNFRWNAKARNEDKRDNKDILGNEPYISAYLTSNSAIEQCSVVYMFPFEAFNKKQHTTKKSLDRIRPKDIDNHTEANRNDTQDNQIEELIEKLGELSQDIDKSFEPDPLTYLPVLGRWIKAENKQEYQRNRSKFEHCLMRLKCIDEGHKMIPYYEKKIQDWDYKKASILEKIAKSLKK